MSFPEDSWVQSRYPLTREQELGDRSSWPWLPRMGGRYLRPGRAGDLRADPELAVQHEGEPVYPVCFRDSSELHAAPAGPEPEPGPEREQELEA